MTDDRKNIKVDEPLFERMKAAKGDRRSWPQFFEDELFDDDADADTVATEVASRIDYAAIGREAAEHTVEKLQERGV